jgi:threonine/homoserine/homoserine lactone efflux protein
MANEVCNVSYRTRRRGEAMKQGTKSALLVVAGVVVFFGVVMPALLIILAQLLRYWGSILRWLGLLCLLTLILVP